MSKNVKELSCNEILRIIIKLFLVTFSSCFGCTALADIYSYSVNHPLTHVFSKKTAIQ